MCSKFHFPIFSYNERCQELFFGQSSISAEQRTSLLHMHIEAQILQYQKTVLHQSINQFSGPAYPWGVAGAAAQVGASKHLDPLQQRIDVLLGCQGETN